MKKTTVIFTFFSVFLVIQVQAQNSFIQKCLGKWQGTMYMYNYGKLKDSVAVKLTIENTKNADIWVWRTEYLSSKMPMVKDYTLKTKDKEKGIYLTDEGDGLFLENFVVDNKMYSLFETEQVYLTANYELINNHLIFEVTSGKKVSVSEGNVTNYAVNNVQKVVFKKIE